MAMADLFSNNILQTKGMIDAALGDFTEADMMARPAKTANHAIWQLGHLANSIRGMVTACEPAAVFPYDDDPAASARAKAGFDDETFFPKKAELIGRFDQAMETAAAWVGRLRDADFEKPTPEGLRKFAPTLGSIATLLSAHAMMHLGQFQVSRRALGKPHLM